MAATWTGPSSGGSAWTAKTLTGCTVGQPVILGFTTSVKTAYVEIYITSGCDYGKMPGNQDTKFFLGGSGAMSMTIVPSATSVAFSIWDFESDEQIKIYR